MLPTCGYFTISLKGVESLHADYADPTAYDEEQAARWFYDGMPGGPVGSILERENAAS